MIILSKIAVPGRPTGIRSARLEPQRGPVEHLNDGEKNKKTQRKLL